MKKKYIKPSIVVETAVLSTLMETVSDNFSFGIGDFGPGYGDVGGLGDHVFEINSKSGFGYFGSWDEEDED